MTRLVIVEGLPCSGKSTTAKFLADTLHFTCVDEGTGDHPADWENHALLDETAYERALSMLFDREEIRAFSCNTERLDCGFVVPLSDRYPPALQEMLDGREIYDELPWDTERPAMLEKWRIFAENCNRGYVFNCVLLQNPMCETMMRFNMPPEDSAAFIGEIADIIRPLEPVVVYLQTTDPAAQIMQTAPARGDWLAAVIGYHCGGGYGRAHGLSGFEGYIAALEERQRRELTILRGLGLQHIVLTDPQRDWHAAYAQLASYFNA